VREEIDRRIDGAAGELGVAGRLLDPRGGNAQIVVVFERFADQRIELWVAECREPIRRDPSVRPARCRPGRRHCHVRQRLRSQLVGLRRRAQRAACQADGNEQRQQRE
jgi:hypothetical protein